MRSCLLDASTPRHPPCNRMKANPPVLPPRKKLEAESPSHNQKSLRFRSHSDGSDQKSFRFRSHFFVWDGPPVAVASQFHPIMAADAAIRDSA